VGKGVLQPFRLQYAVPTRSAGNGGHGGAAVRGQRASLCASVAFAHPTLLHIIGEIRMRKISLVLALAFVGSAAALPQLDPAFTAGAAQRQPVVVAQAASNQPQPRSPSAQNVDDLFRDFTADWVRNEPDLTTWTRYFTGAEQDRLERQLTPRTDAQKRARIQLAKQGLAQLQRFDRLSLSETQRVSADVMQWRLQAYVDGEPFLDDTFPLEQFQGANVNLVTTLVVGHPLLTERDAENYVAALGQVGARMEEAMAQSRRLAAKSVLPPNFILRATIQQMQRFIDPPPSQNPFVATFAQKMAIIKTLPDAKGEQLRAQAENIVQKEIYPTWTTAIALLESQLPRAADEAGLWRLENGAAAYAYFLHNNTTTNMTPDQIHELGLRQVETIEKQMDQTLRRLGRTEGSVKDRIEKLRQDMAYANPTSEESRAQIMRDIEPILRDAEKRAALLFDRTPKSPVVAQPFPRFREANAQADYTGPPPDGSRPGIFQYPLRVEMMTKFGLRTLVYHETVPGHHFDIARIVENKDLPAFRQLGAFGGFPARTEGWGLYAEHLAVESGWYGDDLEGLLGQLYWEEFRARRLVVDTGLHAKHWTRQQAIDYGIEAAEVERYVVWPGQASSYMIGELKILELREKAKQALGDKFSLKDFHNMVIDTGTVPLEILERQTDAYADSSPKCNKVA
jgi:uncharacterized protein (DUF885 family)